MNDSTSYEQVQRDAELKKLDAELRAASNQEAFVNNMSSEDLNDLIGFFDRAVTALQQEVENIRGELHDDEWAAVREERQGPLDKKGAEIYEWRAKLVPRQTQLLKLESDFRNSPNKSEFVSGLDEVDRMVFMRKLERDAQGGENIAALQAKVILAEINQTLVDIETEVGIAEQYIRAKGSKLKSSKLKSSKPDETEFVVDTNSPQFKEALKSQSEDVLVMLEKKFENQLKNSPAPMLKMFEEPKVRRVREETTEIKKAITAVLGERQKDIEENIKLNEELLDGVSDVMLNRIGQHYRKMANQYGTIALQQRAPEAMSILNFVNLAQETRLTSLAKDFRKAENPTEFVKGLNDDQVTGLADKLRREAGALKRQSLPTAKKEHDSGEEHDSDPEYNETDQLLFDAEEYDSDQTHTKATDKLLPPAEKRDISPAYKEATDKLRRILECEQEERKAKAQGKGNEQLANRTNVPRR